MRSSSGSASPTSSRAAFAETVTRREEGAEEILSCVNVVILDRAASRWEQSEAAEFAIVDAGDCVGSIWLNLGPSDRAGVGYWLLPRARGRGLVTRALLLVSRWAFDELGVKRISLLTDPRNASSLRAAERAGFHREGVLRSWADVNGERVDHVSFSLLPSDLSRGPSSASCWSGSDGTRTRDLMA